MMMPDAAEPFEKTGELERIATRLLTPRATSAGCLKCGVGFPHDPRLTAWADCILDDRFRPSRSARPWLGGHPR